MKNMTLCGTAPGLCSLFGGGARKASHDESPLRSDLFSADQMEQHGKVLAGSHQVRSGRARDRLLARLAENEALLLDVHKLLTLDVKADRRVTPAGEWLLDNFYVIEEQIRTAGRHLPKGYSRELPSLARGASAGLPRVYDLALETIAHGDGRVDPENLKRFVTAYQSVTSLKLGELWAIPIMLRLTLIENLRRMAARIAGHRLDRNRAEAWADKMTAVAAQEPQSLILAIADMARSNPPMVSSFVAELTRRLHGQGPALALPLTWIEQRLSESGLTSEELVRSENQQQAADQVSISNSIGSLRALGAMDWRGFVEAMSLVERILAEDPAGTYAAMDFATHDHYRHVVERTAKASPSSESEVARRAIGFAQQALASGGQSDRTAHVGYCLIDEGLAQLERAVGLRSGVAESMRAFGRRHPLLLYCGGILLLTVLCAGGFTGKAFSDGMQGWRLALIGGLSLFCASHLAVALANWLATLLTTPQALPRMDFSKGIPKEFRTLVVVPTMLTNPQGIEDLVKALEVRFLANRDEHLHFGLLTDFCDAPTQTLPEDEPLLRLARERIEGLNAKYRDPSGDSFYLFHRPRRFNPQDAVWMGHERKRGKLSDLNALLRGGGFEAFALVVGDTAVLPEVKYVITLDTDTQLPRDTARQFVGAMAHPLNHPRYDEQQQRVTGGYGILQPRIAASLSGTNRSRYARMCASEIGIDPYTRAVSDVYQDLFGEGSFIGKGIYDVEAFEHVLAGRLPENLILSHDLLEGCYARSGLVSDVELVEDSPSRYDADARRRHRWMRGDWQIAGWLLPRVRLPVVQAGSGAPPRLVSVPNPLSALSRWKILDNLRRSLVPVALMVLFVLGWTRLQPAWVATLSGVAVFFLPRLLGLAADLARKPAELRWREQLAAIVPGAQRGLAEPLLALACLPHEAWISLDAVLRTIWRMRLSGRRLLEWQPSPATDGPARGPGARDRLATLRRMAIAPASALAVGAALAAWRHDAVPAAVVVLVLWLAAPAIAWWLSQPFAAARSVLDAPERAELRQLARRTWGFFETFVTAADHFLPPDNMQELPEQRVAHRTSPTNIGLSLLANLAARDFGYLTEHQLVERTAATFDTMDRLERFHGHFLNWYDTLSLQPLRPAYVSSVDSGNLAGHLLTLRSGLLLLADEPPRWQPLFDGLRDTFALARPIAGQAAAAGPVPRFAALLDEGDAARDPPDPLVFESLHGCAVEMLAHADAAPGAEQAESQRWLRALVGQCAAARDALRRLEPAAPRAAGEPLDPAALLARRAALQALAGRAGSWRRWTRASCTTRAATF